MMRSEKKSMIGQNLEDDAFVDPSAGFQVAGLPEGQTEPGTITAAAEPLLARDPASTATAASGGMLVDEGALAEATESGRDSNAAGVEAEIAMPRHTTPTGLREGSDSRSTSDLARPVLFGASDDEAMSVVSGGSATSGVLPVGAGALPDQPVDLVGDAGFSTDSTSPVESSATAGFGGDVGGPAEDPDDGLGRPSAADDTGRDLRAAEASGDGGAGHGGTGSPVGSGAAPDLGIPAAATAPGNPSVEASPTLVAELDLATSAPLAVADASPASVDMPGMSRMVSQDSGHHAHMEQANALADPADASHVAVNSGAWSDPDTWEGGRVPGAEARVLVPQGVEVVYDVSDAVPLETVRVDGTLSWSRMK